MKKILLMLVLMLIAFSLECFSQPEFGNSSKFYYTSYTKKNINGRPFNDIPSIMLFDLNTGEITKVLDSAGIFGWANSETFIGEYRTTSAFDSARPFLYNINNQTIRELPKIFGSYISVSPDLNYLGFVRAAPGDNPCCLPWNIPIFYDLNTDSLQVIEDYLVNFSDSKFSPDSKKYYFLSSRGKLICFDTKSKNTIEICSLSKFEHLIGCDNVTYDFRLTDNHVVIHMVSSSKAWFIDLKKNCIVKYFELARGKDKIIRTFKILDSNFVLFTEDSLDSINYKSSIFISDLTPDNKRKISPEDGNHYKLCNTVPFISENHVVALRFKVLDFENENFVMDIIDINYKSGDIRVIKSDLNYKENKDLLNALQWRQ